MSTWALRRRRHRGRAARLLPGVERRRNERSLGRGTVTNVLMLARFDYRESYSRLSYAEAGGVYAGPRQTSFFPGCSATGTRFANGVTPQVEVGLR